MITMDIMMLYFSMMMVSFTVSTTMIYTCGWTCYMQTYKMIAWVYGMSGLVALVSNPK